MEEKTQMQAATPTAEESNWALAQRQAKAFAQSAFLPKAFQGENGIANCLIIMNLAKRMGADPMMLAQNVNIIQGRPSMGASYLIASVNASGKFSPLRFEFQGEIGKPGYACRAWAIDRETNTRLDGTWITWEMAQAEGWLSKAGSKWKTMPQQMISYRAASFWQRLYAPEISMGLLSSEEMADIAPTVTTARVIPEAVAELDDLVMDVVEEEEAGDDIHHDEDPV